MASSLRYLATIVSLTIVQGSAGFAADGALNTSGGWKGLSLREKIGQTVILSSDLEAEIRAGGGSLEAFFEKYPATMQLYETEALTVYTGNSLPRGKLISISYGDPHVHDVQMPLAEAAVNVYSDCSASQQALVRALTGEDRVRGPVAREPGGPAAADRSVRAGGHPFGTSS